MDDGTLSELRLAYTSHADMNLALNEIERLATLAGQHESVASVAMTEAERQRSEVERLRAALEDIKLRYDEEGSFAARDMWRAKPAAHQRPQLGSSVVLHLYRDQAPGLRLGR